MTFWLTRKNAAAFKNLTSPALAQALYSLSQPEDIDSSLLPGALLAAGVLFGNSPAALAVLRQGHDQSLEILSIVVSEPFRRHGLARELLHWIQEQALHQGWKLINISYSMGQAFSTAMAKLTDPAQGWQSTDGLRIVRFNRDGGHAFIKRIAPLVQRMHRSSRFGLLPWCDITGDTKQKLGEQLKSPPEFWPQHNNATSLIEQLDESASTVLLDSGNPVGWLLAHRVGATLFRVTRLWIAPAYQGKGNSMLMLDYAVKQYLSEKQTYHNGCFGIAPHNNYMLKLSRRHIEPLGIASFVHKRCFLSLPAKLSKKDHDQEAPCGTIGLSIKNQ